MHTMFPRKKLEPEIPAWKHKSGHFKLHILSHIKNMKRTESRLFWLFYLSVMKLKYCSFNYLFLGFFVPPDFFYYYIGDIILYNKDKNYESSTNIRTGNLPTISLRRTPQFYQLKFHKAGKFGPENRFSLFLKILKKGKKKSQTS